MLVAVALVGALPLTWLAAHRLTGRALPPSPWPSPTIPNPATDADNGLDEVVMGSAWAPEPLPDELATRLADDPALARAFAALTPGRQRSHVLHVRGAKQTETRARRAAQCAAEILAGRGFRER